MPDTPTAPETPDNVGVAYLNRTGPIDMEHLARQTMGDKEVEREVLQLFMHQALQSLAELALADEMQGGAIAHRLQGSARAVGAAGVAAAAGALEDDPGNRLHLASVTDAIADAGRFIDTLSG